MNRLAITLATASALALTACAKKPPAELPPPPQDTSTPADNGPVANNGPVPGSEEHFKSVMNGRDVIYFDTDKYDIDSEDAAALRHSFATQWCTRTRIEADMAGANGSSGARSSTERLSSAVSSSAGSRAAETASTQRRSAWASSREGRSAREASDQRDTNR